MLALLFDRVVSARGCANLFRSARDPLWFPPSCCSVTSHPLSSTAGFLEDLLERCVWKWGYVGSFTWTIVVFMGSSVQGARGRYRASQSDRLIFRCLSESRFLRATSHVYQGFQVKKVPVSHAMLACSVNIVLVHVHLHMYV